MGANGTSVPRLPYDSRLGYVQYATDITIDLALKLALKLNGCYFCPWYSE
jgi:hypothetical protein